MDCRQGFKSLKREDIEKALRRAAKRARELARLHGTPLVIWEDGKLVEKHPKPKVAKKARAKS